jgi:hypothetical protein
MLGPPLPSHELAQHQVSCLRWQPAREWRPHQEFHKSGPEGKIFVWFAAYQAEQLVSLPILFEQHFDYVLPNQPDESHRVKMSAFVFEESPI